ncbi:hypothetical protein HYQ45_018893 [Verticillium longisporum]|uniref:Uncharacterized protein n=1 Tax=Verticillium longisporum TaxID=100787 RepID=A0A8I2ZQP4_VERLO|nr:hypothetical protein HYQ45_018893 [Verticillium longisporum]
MFYRPFGGEAKNAKGRKRERRTWNAPAPPPLENSRRCRDFVAGNSIAPGTPPTLDSAAHTGLKTESGADKGGVTPKRASRLDEARDSLRRKPKQPAPGAGL